MRMPTRPNIFQYHDYQIFLKDWLAYRKASQSGFSLRSLAKLAGLASGYLPMVLSGKRPLSGAAMAKLVPFLGLNSSEQSFFENLVVLGTTDSHEARLTALDRMKRFQKFQKNNPNEAEAYDYLTHWYYVVIREMAAMKGFRLDPEWILKELRFKIPLNAIKDALEFLKTNGHIQLNADGSVRPPEKFISAKGGVYRVALSKFHREIFSLAARSIEKTPSDQRNIQGRTFALKAEDFDQANEIVEEALEKIRKLSEGKADGDSVYHLEIALFPLTQSQVVKKKRG
jgi:uncharacterized protein (TIGR02147 family)